MSAVRSSVGWPLGVAGFLAGTAAVRAVIDFDPPGGMTGRMALAFVVLAVWVALATAVVSSLTARFGCATGGSTSEGSALLVVGVATLFLGGQLTTTYLGTGELTAQEIVLSTLATVIAITVVVGAVDLFRRRQRRRS